MNIRQSIGGLRAGAISRQIAPFIVRGEKMLDIGSGGCVLAKKLIETTGVDLTLLDTVDHNKTDLNLNLYDGVTIPFDDKSFSTSSLVFVLHHAANHANLLSEAARVSSSQVLVVEDSPSNRYEKRLWGWLDFKMNHAIHEDIDIAHGTKTAEEWEVEFNEAGLVLDSVHEFRSLSTTGLLYPHTLYQLRPDKS